MLTTENVLKLFLFLNRFCVFIIKINNTFAQTIILFGEKIILAINIK
jgi:hypothetical protein